MQTKLKDALKVPLHAKYYLNQFVGLNYIWIGKDIYGK